MPIRPIESPLTAPPPLTNPPKEESPERTVQEGVSSEREAVIPGNMMESGGDSPASETSSVIRHESDINDEQSEETERVESPERETERPILEDRQKSENSSQTLRLEVESQIRFIKQTIQQTVPFI